MKKFALLLALVAVFAMSASAFAAAPASDDVTAVANNGASNIDKIAGSVEDGYTANMYYLKGVASDDKVLVALNVTIAKPTSPDVTKTYLKDGPTTATLDVKSGDIKDDVISMDITLNAISFDKTLENSSDLVIQVAVSDDKVSPDLTISLKEVAYAPETKVVEGKLGEIVLDSDLVFGKSVDVTTKPASADVSINADGKVVVDVIEAVKSGDVIKFTLAVSEDSILYNGAIVLAGAKDMIPAAGYEFTVDVPVVADPNKSALDEVLADAADDGVTLSAAAYSPAMESEVTTATTEERAASMALLTDIDPTAENVGDTMIDVELNAAGGFTVIRSSDINLTTGSTLAANETLRFVKVFVNGTNRTAIEIDAFDTWTQFPYHVVIIDTKAPDAFKLNTTGFEDFGFHLGERTLYIWDGNENGVAFDPIFAVKTTNQPGSSSSGACSMGFGLAAIAGLAALALRKRSK